MLSKQELLELTHTLHIDMIEYTWTGSSEVLKRVKWNVKRLSEAGYNTVWDPKGECLKLHKKGDLPSRST